MPKNWVMILILAVVFISGCTRSDRNTTPAKSDVQIQNQPHEVAKPKAAEPTAQDTPAVEVVTKQKRFEQSNLYEQLKTKKSLSPGTTLDLAQIPEPTQEELADPKMDHLNEATKRTLVMFRKLQRKLPQLTTSTHDGAVPVANEAKMFNALNKKTKKNKKNKRKRRKKRRRVKRGIK